MITNYYKTKKKITVKNLTIEKGEKIIASMPNEEGFVTIFKKYWFEYPVHNLIFIENFTIS